MNRQRIEMTWHRRPDCVWFDCGGHVNYTEPGPRKGGVFEFGPIRFDLWWEFAYDLGEAISKALWRRVERSRV